MTDRINIIHANNNVLIRNGLKTLLFQGGGIGTLFQASNVRELNEAFEKEKPNLLIIDYLQPDGFTVNEIIEIRKKYSNLKVLVICSDQNNARILSILETGVRGYLTHECNEGEIINAIFAIARGEKCYCNKVINIILEKHIGGGEPDCTPISLSERETEIVTYIAKGFKNRDIADQLFISPHTVSTHRKNIMKKLDINSVSGLTLYAVNAGLVNT